MSHKPPPPDTILHLSAELRELGPGEQKAVTASDLIARAAVPAHTLSAYVQSLASQYNLLVEYRIAEDDFVFFRPAL